MWLSTIKFHDNSGNLLWVHLSKALGSNAKHKLKKTGVEEVGLKQACPFCLYWAKRYEDRLVSVCQRGFRFSSNRKKKCFIFHKAVFISPAPCLCFHLKPKLDFHSF